MPREDRRFSALIASSVRDFADELQLGEPEVRNVLFRMIQAGQHQGRRAATARQELARTLGPSFADFDLVPDATVRQARRLATLRRSLLAQGALPTTAIAEGRGMKPSTARTWLSRQRKAHRLFTVNLDGETVVPAFLLDDAFEPRDAARPAIEALRSAGEDGWALWAWFATPSAWLGGQIPADVLATDPGKVAESARRRAAASA